MHSRALAFPPVIPINVFLKRLPAVKTSRASLGDACSTCPSAIPEGVERKSPIISLMRLPARNSNVLGQPAGPRYSIISPNLQSQSGSQLGTPILGQPAGPRRLTQKNLKIKDASINSSFDSDNISRSATPPHQHPTTIYCASSSLLASIVLRSNCAESAMSSST